MADWDLVGVTPAAKYETKAKFSADMDSAYGRGKWKETSGYRSPSQEDALRRGGAGTVPTGRASHHSLGTPDAPGAYDVTMAGVDPRAAIGRLPKGYKGVPEGAQGGQGAHLHINVPEDTGADGWSLAGVTPPKAGVPKPATPTMSHYDRAVADARKGAAIPAWEQPIHEFNRQATFQGSEALEAGLYAGASQLPRLTGKDPGYGPGDAYNAARQIMTEETKSRASGANTAAGVAGGVAGLLLPVGKLGAAAKGARFATAAKEGAKIGAVAGAAGAHKYQDVPGEAAVGGVAGAMTGPAAEVGLSAIKLGAKTFHTLTNNRFGSAVSSAENMLRKAFEKGGLEKSQIDAQIAKWRASGVSPSMIDIGGKHVQQLVRKAGGAGPAQHILRRYEQGVEENLARGAVQRTKQLVREKRPAAEVQEGLEKVREEVAATKYPRQYATPVGVEPFMSSIGDKELRPVLNAARKTAAFNRQYDKVAEIDNLINLNSVANRAKPEEMAGYLREHPQTVSAGTMGSIQSAVQRAAKEVSKTNKEGAKGLYERAAEIGGLLDHVPELKDARNTYRIHSEMINGFEKGSEFLKEGSGFMTQKAFAALNKGARQTARIGARQALEDALNGGTVAALKKIESNSSAHEVLTMLFGADEAARYSRAAKYRLEKLTNARYAASGGVPAEGNAVGFLSTSPIGVAKHAALKGVEKAGKGMSEKEAEALAVLGKSRARTISARPEPIRRKAGKMIRRATGIAISNAAGYDQ